MTDNTKNSILAIIISSASCSLGGTIFVDNQLADHCTSGEYSITNRDNSGSDGDAYNTPEAAASVAAAGDTIYFRSGTYSQTARIVIYNKTGTSPSAKITFANYNSELVIIDGTNVPSLTDYGLFSITNSDYVALKGMQVTSYVQMGVTYRNSDHGEVVDFIVENMGKSGIYLLSGSDYAVVENVISRNNGWRGIAVGDSNHVSVTHSECYDNAGIGILLRGCSHCLIDRNECFHNSIGVNVLWRDSIALRSTYNGISNNLLHDNTVNPENADGMVISTGSSYNTVTCNVVYGNADDGIDVSAGSGATGSASSLYATVTDNIVFDNGDGPSGAGDGNGVKVSTNSGGGHVVGHNISFDNDRGGFDQDKASGYPQNFFYNNIAYNNGTNIISGGYSGFVMDAPSLPQDEDAVLYNNIAAENATKDLFRSNELAVNDSDYNFWGDGDFVSDMDEHSLSGDPLFRNPDLVIDTTFESGWSVDEKLEYIRSQVREKFSLRAGSEAIDRGTVISGYHNTTPGDDAGDGRVWYGASPDIGAYEVALAAIADVSVSSTSQNSVTIVWTAPNQEAYRTPTHYDIRYATYALDESNWDTATQVQGQPVPGDSGDAQSFTLANVNPGTAYYVAIKTGDELENSSLLSNVVSAVTASSGNSAPLLETIGDRSVFETQTLTFVISAADADGDALTYTATNVPTGATFTAATRTFAWTPTNTQSGTYHVMFQVSDGQVTVSETITIVVSAIVNHAPVLAEVGDRNVTESALLSLAISATDGDDDPLSFSATGLPAGANFTDQLFSWVPTYEQAGSYTVTFTVSDGELTDSEEIAIVVANVVPDLTVPTANDIYPLADAIQIPLNALVKLSVADSGHGVDANTVIIRVNDQTVYSGNSTSYDSAYGTCRRTGTPASYSFSYQPDEDFDFDEQVTVRVTASDLAGNAMTALSYAFTTEMRAFGINKIVSWGPSDVDKGHAATACDSSGTVWAVYHAGSVGQRDIYISKMAVGDSNFAGPVQLTTNAGDQTHPSLAVDSDDKLYIVWQDNRLGNWDIYGRTSIDGVTWSVETQITESDDDQVAPVVAVDGQSPSTAWVAWQDDGAGHQDIYVASSSNDFLTNTSARVTSDAGDQTNPDIAVDTSGVVYLVWTDTRNGSNDIYGADSEMGPWTNVAVATGTDNQHSPCIATEAMGTVLHLAWVDDTSGDSDICYATSDGMPSSSLAGTNVIDDTSGAIQTAPTLAVTGSTGAGLNVFVCWQDGRNTTSGGVDTDLYFADVETGNETNILVGDGGTGSNQSEPAIGIDGYGHPYVVWTDSRNVNVEIYHAGSTHADSDAVDSDTVTASAGGTVGVAPPAAVGDVSVVIPAGACSHDVAVTIAQIENPQFASSSAVLAYEFGPSGLQFSTPVTITIPYAVADFPDGTPTPYWYDSQTGSLIQQGITDIESITISDTIHALRFRTTHFTPYGLFDAVIDGGDDAVDGVSSSGGGGGGCALSPTGDQSLAGFLLPYLAVAMAMALLRRRDRKAHHGMNR